MTTVAFVTIAWIGLNGICAFALLYAADRWTNRSPEPDANLDDLLDHLDIMRVARALGVIAHRPQSATRTVTFRCVDRRWTRDGAA